MQRALILLGLAILALGLLWPLLSRLSLGRRNQYVDCDQMN